MVDDAVPVETETSIQASTAYQEKFDRSAIGIAEINVMHTGDVIVIPYHGELCWGHDVPGSATEIAVLAHRYGIATDPDQASEYGASVTVKAGQLGKLLGVLVKHGLGRDIADVIAREQEVTIPSARSLRQVRFYDEETGKGAFPFRDKEKRRRQKPKTQTGGKEDL